MYLLTYLLTLHYVTDLVLHQIQVRGFHVDCRVITVSTLYLSFRNFSFVICCSSLILAVDFYTVSYL